MAASVDQGVCDADYPGQFLHERVYRADGRLMAEAGTRGVAADMTSDYSAIGLPNPLSRPFIEPLVLSSGNLA